MEDLILRYKNMMRDPQQFATHITRTPLRNYQRGVMQAVVDSVLLNRGYSFVVMFPRQSGKNELQALLEAYLMTLFAHRCVELIKVSPTLRPQAQICIRRFENVMRRNVYIRNIWKKEGNAYRMGGARLNFISAALGSNIVGATASGLLEVDEAQQVSIEKYDRDVAPMAASTNATRVFWGTAWTSTTLLGRELRAAQEAEQKDGLRRVFRISAEEVYAEVPDYRRFVEEKVARQGRNHPLVRTQYFSEEVDGTGGMFPAERIARMRGSQPAPAEAKVGMITALLLDVAGEDEGARGLDGTMSAANPARDATALTLVEVVLGQPDPEGSAGCRRDSRRGSDAEEFDCDNRMVGFHSRSGGTGTKEESNTNVVEDDPRQPTLRGIEAEEHLCDSRRGSDAEEFDCDNRMVGFHSRSGGTGTKEESNTNVVEDDPRQPNLRGIEAEEHLCDSRRGSDAEEFRNQPALPVYRLLKRWQWIGAKHTTLQSEVYRIALEWKTRAVVVDATGVGAGLASFLEKALPGRVTPFTFSSASKSQLGWDFLAIVDSGRWQEPPLADLPGNDQFAYQRQFFNQLAACQFEVKADTRHTMRWSVPDGSRDPQNGELLHDDWVLSAALCAVLEKMDWAAPGEPFMIRANDPLKEMDQGF